MNKSKIFSLLIAVLLLAGCDYNDKYFDGYDDAVVSDIAKYEGEFTGKYPTIGYFTDNAAAETAINTMLKGIYKYCDKGSTAKVSVLFGDITEGMEQGETPDVSYVLSSADYDAMGTDKGFPGKYDNFDATMNVDSFLVAFCNTKYATNDAGTLVRLVYTYYASSVSSTKVKFFEKGTDGFAVKAVSAYVPTTIYSLVKADYDSMGTESGTPGKYDNFDANMNIDFYLAKFLAAKYPYAKADATCEVLYAYYYKVAEKNVTVTKSRIYKCDGTSWSFYDPYADVTDVTTKIAEMTFDGSNWKLQRMIGGSVKYTLAEADYATLVAWVKANKNAYMSNQNIDQEEYYFGASAKYFNINNKYSTWKTYYDPEKLYTDKTDAQMQTIMDARMEEAIRDILLPKWVETPDPGLSYVVAYKVYGGRGDGMYVMSFMYNTTTSKYELISGPVAQ
ncbi:hypothetical protein [Bacteroides graminisolvens]|uniref:hypothetical protein n=1 Tax=Bacteroides graminisolvens TaxID=477666 RepID=UPI0023F025B9|nr:hypothetical protein [Bacteroides graminisolvens]MDD3210528.1 hypothetical protein [Bacteroides graminisolvens]